MILQSLREFALREGLVDNPAFESKPVRWIVALNRDGRFLGVSDTNSIPITPEGKKGKPRPEAKMMVIPRRRTGRAGIGALPDFLVDNAKYALGITPESSELDGRLRLVHESFITLLKETQKKVNSTELVAVLKFLADREAVKLCATELEIKQGFASNDLFTFSIADEYLHESEDLCKFWAKQKGSNTEDAQTQQCLLCGELKSIAKLHLKVQVPGTDSSGAPLVSFNAAAFEKYGWSQNENAPFCHECMTSYAEALRRLTRARYVLPRDGTTVSSLSTSLTADTTAVYWSDGESPLISILPSLRDEPKKVADLLSSPHQGMSKSIRDAERFYCLILTGAQGRAIVRKVHAGTVAEVQENLRRYFRAIDVDRFDKSAPMPLFRLLQSMVLKGELDRLPPEIGADLWLAALFGLPLSRSFLTAVVTRNRAEQKVTPERAALLQFYFISRNRKSVDTDISENSEEKGVPMSLDRNNTDKAYLLGRLLAVLENLQTAAQSQGLNRTIVDRFFGAASTRPGVVFPQLIQLAQHHKAKAGRSAAGRTVNLDKQLGEIIDGLNAGEGFGATLNLEEQGRFAIGYYQQRQSFFRKPEDRKEQSSDLTTEEIAQ